MGNPTTKPLKPRFLRSLEARIYVHDYRIHTVKFKDGKWKAIIKYHPTIFFNQIHWQLNEISVPENVAAELFSELL